MTDKQEYMHRYYEAHKHRYKEYQKKYNAEHKEQIKAYDQKNKEKIKAYSKKYYRKNKDMWNDIYIPRQIVKQSKKISVDNKDNRC